MEMKRMERSLEAIRDEREALRARIAGLHMAITDPVNSAPRPDGTGALRAQLEEARARLAELNSLLR